MPEKDSLVPVQVALNHCPGCDEYGASHTIPSIEHPAQVAPACPTCGGKGLIALNIGLCPACHPAVPAQEAPTRKECTCPGPDYFGEIFDSTCELSEEEHDALTAEPQAGAQALFPGANDMRAPTGMENLRDTPPIVYEGNMAFAQFVGVIEEAEQAGAQVPQKGPWKVIEDADFSGSKDYPFMIVLDRGAGPCEPNVVASRMSKANADLIVAQAGAQVPSQDALAPGWLQRTANRVHAELTELDRLREALTHIKSYATEAAKTPITREDMHDPLKAQTFFDEAKGFERLVLGETK